MSSHFYFGGFVAARTGNRCFPDRCFIAPWTSDGGTGMIHPVMTYG